MRSALLAVAREDRKVESNHLSSVCIADSSDLPCDRSLVIRYCNLVTCLFGDRIEGTFGWRLFFGFY